MSSLMFLLGVCPRVKDSMVQAASAWQMVKGQGMALGC